MGGPNRGEWLRLSKRELAWGGSPPSAKDCFSAPPLLVSPSWPRQIQNETDESQKRQSHIIIHVKTEKPKKPNLIYLPPVRPPSKEKSWLLEERKTNCIYLVLGSLAQILDLSPSRYHCDSFESKQHYFLSVSVFSLFLLWSHCLIVGYQPSLSPCPEHPLRPEQSWCGFPPILLAASETFPLRAQSLHLWYYNLGFDSKTGENPLSAPGKWNGILSSELKAIYLAAGCHWDWISPTLEGFQSTCISRSLLEKKALGCILCVSWSSSQPPCRGHISRQLFH